MRHRMANVRRRNINHEGLFTIKGRYEHLYRNFSYVDNVCYTRFAVNSAASRCLFNLRINAS